MRIRSVLVVLYMASVSVCGLPAYAQATNPAVLTVPLCSDFDVDDDAAFRYPITVGNNGDVWSRGVQLPGNVTNSSSSATVTAVSGLPFQTAAVGDEVEINFDGVVYPFYLAAVTDDENADLDEAFDFSTGKRATTGYAVYLRDRTVATTGGWIPTLGRRLLFQVQLDQIVATNVTYQFECRMAGSNSDPVIVIGPEVKTATGSWVYEIGQTGFKECRLGVKITADDGDDLTTNMEQFSAYVALQ